MAEFWGTELTASTHNVLLPTFDEDHNLIAANDHQTLELCSAVVQVHFGLVQYFVKQEKKSVFTTVVCEIFILRPPPMPPINLLKCGSLMDSPSMSCSVPAKNYVM